MTAKMVDASGNVIAPLPIRIVNEAGESIGELRQGGVTGPEFLTLTLYRANIENVRNIQGGVVGDPNLDISAGGDGSPDNPRGVVVVNGDNGRGIDLGRGRPTRKPALSLRTYDDGTKDLVTLNVPFRFAKGAFVQTSTGWRRLT